MSKEVLDQPELEQMDSAVVESETVPESTAEGDAEVSPPTHPKPERNRRVYKRKPPVYKHEMEAMEEFRGWLSAYPQDTSKAFCNWCKRPFSAQLCKVRRHAMGKSHLEAEKNMKCGTKVWPSRCPTRRSTRLGLPRKTSTFAALIKQELDWEEEEVDLKYNVKSFTQPQYLKDKQIKFEIVDEEPEPVPYRGITMNLTVGKYNKGNVRPKEKETEASANNVGSNNVSAENNSTSPPPIWQKITVSDVLDAIRENCFTGEELLKICHAATWKY